MTVFLNGAQSWSATVRVCSQCGEEVSHMGIREGALVLQPCGHVASIELRVNPRLPKV